jgi:hypothetical protein
VTIVRERNNIIVVVVVVAAVAVATAVGGEYKWCPSWPVNKENGENNNKYY